MQLKLVADSGGEFTFPRLLWRINREDPSFFSKRRVENVDFYKTAKVILQNCSKEEIIRNHFSEGI